MDIVDEMLRVAAGYPLSYTQSDIGINGTNVVKMMFAV